MDKKLFLFGIVVVFVVCSMVSNAASVEDTLTLGSTKTYALDGDVFQVTLDFLDSNNAIFRVNGTKSEKMEVGNDKWIVAGVNGRRDRTTATILIINLKKIVFQDFAGGVHYVEFDIHNRKTVVMHPDAGSSIITTEGEAWRVGTSTKILEMGESAAFGANRETIGQIVNFQFIDETELPSLLKSGIVKTSKGDFPYDQRMYFEGNNTGYVMYTEDDGDNTADFFYISSGAQIARYELEFTKMLNSNLFNSNGQVSANGTVLADIKYTSIEILGGAYTILKANTIPSVQNSLNLSLLHSFLHDNLMLGTTKTYLSSDKKIYRVTLDFVDHDSVKLKLNDEASNDIGEGSTHQFSNGMVLGISKILFQNGTGISSIEFYLGPEVIELSDLNILDDTSSKKLKVNEEEIDDAQVFLMGAITNNTYLLEKISVNITADDDFYVSKDWKLSENSQLAEPEVLLTKNWDIEYKGLSDVSTELIEIKANGKDDYELVFSDGQGDIAKIPLANVPAANRLKFGDNNDDLIVNESKAMSKDDYFIVSDTTDENGDRVSFALRYRGSDKSTDDDPKLKFDNIGSGENIEVPLNIGVITNATTVAVMGGLELSGKVFNVYNASSHTASSDMNIFVDLNGDGVLLTAASDVTLNTQFGAQIAITNTSNGIRVTINTPNTDDFDDLTPSPFIFNITVNNNEVELSKSWSMVHQFRTPEDEDNNQYAYSSYGALALYTTPSNEPEELKIWYPSEQRVPQVWIVGKNDLTAVNIDTDCDKNGIPDTGKTIVGNATTINSNSIKPTVEIDGSTNLSKSYSGEKRVKVKHANKVVLEFDFEFGESPLCLPNYKIEKQLNSSNAGSLIIQGIVLPTNKTKTVYIDNLNNITTLCIKDAQITSIDQISSLCNQENEFGISCPGSKGNYNCNFTDSNKTTFKVTGLMHSGVNQQTYCGDGIVNGAETCDNCPNDAGSCPVQSNSGGGGGGSGGGGGGGSYGSASNSFVCNMDWKCGEWSECIDSWQRRECDFIKVPQHTQPEQCPSATNFPQMAKKCTIEAPKQIIEETAESASEQTQPEETPIESNSITGQVVGVENSNKGRPIIGILTLLAIGILAISLYYRFYKKKQ